MRSARSPVLLTNQKRTPTKKIRGGKRADGATRGGMATKVRTPRWKNLEVHPRTAAKQLESPAGANMNVLPVDFISAGVVNALKKKKLGLSKYLAVTRALGTLLRDTTVQSSSYRARYLPDHCPRR